MSARATGATDRHVGAKLRALRKARGMTLAELGRALGVTPTQVQKYERGTDRIGAGTLFYAAEAFRVEIGAFYEGLE